ncbi:pyrimidine/purine nucleoside phosphorylase [Lonsdalea iberica]|uniref:Pyrimidine/purine nucleoside phosphorylase n=1 Tax=Lonsdalea iberica TaxID=1082703 RepID=A0A1X3RXB7_9GAMM|nr:pyrimidine/purine nucleoside phosphorylase [Lonsdalea iberica]OSN06609.1 hypothetical protein AU511_06585 [Lonsdalea iberica]
MLQVNEYFSGKVKSVGFDNSTDGRASVGVMAEGEYTFGTGQAEEMTVISGALNVLLPGAVEWQLFSAGEMFSVPGHSEFNLQVAEPTAYLCKYL